MLVHFDLYAKDLKLIIQYCKRKNIKIIEGVLTHWIKIAITAGNIGIAGCSLSFKTITTGEGGILTTNDRSIYKLALSLKRKRLGKRR